jgi:hypothetical protein
MVTMDDGKVNAKSPHAIGAQKSARLRRAVEGPKSSHPLEKGAATIDVYGKGVAILLRRHSWAIAKFLRISPQQFDAVIVEPLGAFNDAQQISCMRQSIVALEVLSSEAGDNRSLIVIAHNFTVSHGRFPGRVWATSIAGVTLKKIVPH